MSGEGVSSRSSIGNGWKDPYSSNTRLKTRHFLGKRRRTNPVAFRTSTLEDTGKCAVASTTNSKNVGTLV